MQIFARRVGPAAVRLLGKGISFRVCVARSWAAPQVHGPTGLGCVGPAAVRLPGLRTRVCQLGFAWPCSPSGPSGPNMPRRPRPPRQAGRPKRPRPPRRPKRPRRPEQPRRPKRPRRNMPKRPSRPLPPARNLQPLQHVGAPVAQTCTPKTRPGYPRPHPKPLGKGTTTKTLCMVAPLFRTSRTHATKLPFDATDAFDAYDAFYTFDACQQFKPLAHLTPLTRFTFF